jgi:copper chaperone CopZ
MAIQFIVPSMACGACVGTITKSIQAVDAQAEVNANLKSKQVEVETALTEAEIRSAIAAAGYPVQ